ncbi:hypothetical protein [uncultured Fibrella sp.]
MPVRFFRIDVGDVPDALIPPTTIFASVSRFPRPTNILAGSFD